METLSQQDNSNEKIDEGFDGGVCIYHRKERRLNLLERSLLFGSMTRELKKSKATANRLVRLAPVAHFNSIRT